MEPVTTPPRAATSEPASLPSRASMGKADFSPSRKRARLDSGPRAIRGTSEDPISPVLKHTELHTPPAVPTSPTQRIESQPEAILPTTPQARVTINVRTNSMPSSKGDASVTATEHMSQLSENGTSPNIEPGASPPYTPNRAQTSPSLSPTDSPVIELEVEDMVEDVEPTVIEIDSDERDPAVFFAHFPYRDEASETDLTDILKIVVEHFGADKFDTSHLLKLAGWLQELAAYQPFSIIPENHQIWDYMGKMTHVLSNRTSIPVSGRVFDTDILRDRLEEYMSSYMLLFSYLLQVDTALLYQFPPSYPFQTQQYLHIFRHVRTLAGFFLHDTPTPLLRTLGRLSDPLDVTETCQRIACNFVKAPTNGLRHLCGFLTTCHGRVNSRTMVDCFRIFNNILSYVQNSSTPCFQADEISMVRSELIDVFRGLDKELQEVGRVLPIDLNKELLSMGTDFLLNALHGLFQPVTSAPINDLCVEILGEATKSYENELLPAIVAQTWRHKLLHKYITKGRMELRVACVIEMDLCLVNLYKSSGNDGQHPLLQYVAGLLLQLKIIDYIVGVDSHPQLIQRSGNIVGFLVVTHRYTETETDKIWRTITTSQDPRVVSAMIHMLGSIIHLMQPRQALYILSEKFGTLPIQDMSNEMLLVFRSLCSKLAPHPQEAHDAINWNAVDPRSNPYRICFEMVRETSPYAKPAHRRESISKEAAMQLRAFSTTLPIAERARILDSSVQRIRNQDEDALADIHAIQAVAALSFSDDAKILTQDLELARYLVPEICAFVKREQSKPSHHMQVPALNSRLDLLVYIIQRDAQSISDDLFETLWCAILGRGALNNMLRDLAWRKFCELAKFDSENMFLKKLLEHFVPKLEPVYFTTCFFDFVTHITEFAWKKFMNEWRPGAVVEIPNASLLWRLIVTAPNGTIETSTSKILAGRYIEILKAPSVTLEAVEDSHVALANECLDRLGPAFAAIREKGESMLVDSPHQRTDLHSHELTFTRTLLFMGTFVSMLRLKSEFYPRPAASEQRPITPDLPITGDPVTIQFQVFHGQESPIKRLTIGGDDTLRNLKDRLTQITGLSCFRVIARGTDLDLDIQASKTIKEMQGLTDWLLIRSQPDVVQPHSSSGLSKFEQTTMAHFEDLYQYLDSDDFVSESTSSFLSQFAAVESVVIVDPHGHNDAAQIFPAARPFAARYNCRALGTCLQSQFKQGTVEKDYVKATIKILSHTLVHNPLIDRTFKQQGAPSTVALFLETTLMFMKQRPFDGEPVDYFGDEAAFVAGLVELIKSALSLPTEVRLVCWCLSTILEACLHSIKVWNTFTDAANISALLRQLLLEDTRIAVRMECGRAIESVCTESSVAQSISTSEIIKVIWQTLSGIVSDSEVYPKQSGQLFMIADIVFRKYDEQTRDEAELKSLFEKWSLRLLNYEHKEIVGRFEVDHIVAGYTKLLSACALSLKSYKKPLEAHDLIDQLFSKFLFIRHGFDVLETYRLPVMDTETRKGLYDLILILCEDSEACEQIYTDLLPHTLDSEPVLDRRSYMFDRDDEIRSCTGYVGVYNPRNICYMNSLMTQLFMNREFRRFMLNMHITESTGSQRLLAETQKLFAHLQNSYAKAADPRDFAACVRGIDGESIDITVQMDADEFYNLLFDQWEQQMLSNNAKQHFRSFYGGKTVTQIKSHECEHVSEREESFFVVQCDVKGKPNLMDSLQSYVQGDVMEGDNKYKCEKCGGKFVDAVKRTCLKEVPDNLILHLKRFDFDLTNMTRAKIDDLFEFPDKLDVSPYNVKHLSHPDVPTTPDVFELVGVLIHQGTAEGGHYYSLIRERPSGSSGPPTWLEFNDRDVTELQAQMISSMGFGGFSEEAYTQNQSGPRCKQFSAYMLFYQRTSTIVAEQKALRASASGPQKVPIPPTLEEDIAADNESVVRIHGVFDPNHAKFIKQLFHHQRNVLYAGGCSENHGMEKAALFVTIQYVRQVVARNRDLPELDEIGKLLRESINGCIRCCANLLQALVYENTIHDLLFRCPYPKVRTKTRLLLLEALKILRTQDRDLYGLKFSDGYLKIENVGLIGNVVARLVNIIHYQLLNSTRGWDDIFGTILELCVGEDRFGERALILTEGVLLLGLEILAGSVSKRAQQRWDGIATVLEKKRNIYNKLIELVHELLTAINLRAAIIPDKERDIASYDSSTMRFPLSKSELTHLSHYHDDDSVLTVLGKALDLWDRSKERDQTDFAPGKLLSMFLEAHPPFGRLDHLHKSILVNVCDLNWPFSEPYIRAAVWYCQSCHRSNLINELMRLVAESVSTQQPCVGMAYVSFFADLLEIQNERLYDDTDPDFFYQRVIRLIPLWGPGFLLHDEEWVRKRARTLLSVIFNIPISERTRRSNELKYKALRDLIRVLIRKLGLETRNGASRNAMYEFQQTLSECIETLDSLAGSDEPDAEQYQEVDDRNSIFQWQNQIDQILAVWPVEEDDTLVSGNEAFENSDFGSESDFADDIP